MIEFIRIRFHHSKVAKLLVRTALKWQRDECLEMGAALSYYALFSLFPLLLVILSVFGRILGPNTDAYHQILQFAQDVLPQEAYTTVENTLINLNSSSIGAGLVGFGLLLLTASKIFEALDKSVDKIWQTHRNPQSKPGLANIALVVVKDKITAFLMVLGTGLALFLSLLSNLAIKIFLEILNNFESAVSWVPIDRLWLVKSLQSGISACLLIAAIASLLKILPSTRLSWRDIWPGAIVTVILMSLLQQLVSNGIIRIGEQFRAYGAIGNVMVLMLWIYLTCQIFFLGCEFTFAYTYLYGSRRRHPESELVQ